MLKLLAFKSDIIEPEIDVPSPGPDTPYASFAEPPVSPGGFVNLSLDPSIDPKPSGITVVYLPAGQMTEATVDVNAIVAADSGYPTGTIALTDPSLTAVTIQTASRPEPGKYDVAVVGVFADQG